VVLAVALIACSSKAHEVHDAAGDPPPTDGAAGDPPPTDGAGVDAGGPAGKWTTGDLHLHTIESNDAQVPLATVLDAAFARNHLDWIALSNHLRVSDRDDQGTAITTGPVPLSSGLARYEVPAIAALKHAGTYADLWFYSNPIFVTVH
jgi:hypothetical protein